MRQLTAGLLLLTAVTLAGAGSSTDVALRQAADAWDRGDYVTALTAYVEVLDSPAAERVLEPVARHTGELFRTIELTTDGGAPAFAPGGRMLLYEAGTGALRTTKIVALGSGAAPTPIATLQGHSASFSPDGSKVIYLKVPPTSEISDLEALAAAATGLERARRSQALQELVGVRARIAVRDVASGREVEIDTGSVRKSSPAAAAQGAIVFLGWSSEGEPDQLYVVREGAAPRRLTTGPADKRIAAVNASGTVIAFTLRPPPGQPGPSAVGILTLPDATVSIAPGSAPALAADGRRVAYVSHEGGEYRLILADAGDLNAGGVVRRGRDRLDAPALSPDGRRVLFQAMPQQDWDIYLHTGDAPGDARVTRDIQHDVLPRFLTPDRILALMGETRHRRSYLYDLPSMTRTRLFHNNTIRTISPEYAWVPDEDGARILIVAERDGDTVSPERGVYLVDLTQRVTAAGLRARLAANLAAEQARRAAAQRMYAPMAGAVRQALEAVSTGRIFEYQKALFEFDSKHITRPGNAHAARYLFDTYASFGYEPRYQWFSPRTALGGQTANVLATLKGTTHPELIYVVSSHYDSVAAGPGADDNSSGTAALLETARILKDRPQPATIVFASFTAEESGLLGSREYVRRAVADRLQIVGALNNDMIGWANNHRLDSTIRYSNPGIRDVQHAAAMLFTNLITYDALYYKNTDAAAYYETYGDIVGGLGAYPILGNPHYHQPHDVLETINHQLVTEVAKTTAASVMLLASSPSRINGLKVKRRRDGVATVSWTPSPERDITHYVVTWGPGSRDSGTGRTELQQMKATEAGATIPGARRGTEISVKAVNARGLEGWDWARTTVE